MIVESLRNSAGKNPVVMGGIATGVILVALGSIVWQSVASSPSSGPGAYFFDEETSEISLRPDSELPPLPGKSGRPTLVRAIYFCTANNAQRWIGYLEKIEDSAVAQVREEMAKRPAKGLITGPPPLYRKNLMVRLPEPASPWVKADSPEGTKIATDIRAPGNPSAKVFRADPATP